MGQRYTDAPMRLKRQRPELDVEGAGRLASRAQRGRIGAAA